MNKISKKLLLVSVLAAFSGSVMAAEAVSQEQQTVQNKAIEVEWLNEILVENDEIIEKMAQHPDVINGLMTKQNMWDGHPIMEKNASDKNAAWVKMKENDDVVERVVVSDLAYKLRKLTEWTTQTSHPEVPYQGKFGIRNLQGVAIAATGKPTLFDVSEAKVFQEAIRTGHGWHAPKAKEGKEGQFSLSFGAPVYNDKKELIGVLQSAMSMTAEQAKWLDEWNMKKQDKK